MAFGQPLGPPASHRQISELLALLQAAGHVGFRDARGPMGFTQRQGNGKFTRDEADAFIILLTESESDTAPQDDGRLGEQQVRMTAQTKLSPVTAAQRRAATQARTMPSELLAAELQRRGWAVIEP